MFAFVDLVLIPASRHEVPIIVWIVGVGGEVIWIFLVVGRRERVNDGGVVIVLVVFVIGRRRHSAGEEDRCLVWEINKIRRLSRYLDHYATLNTNVLKIAEENPEIQPQLSERIRC